MVHINLAVPTSSPDDRGIPHTLEHLVFKGSQRYPKPGTLQEAAARLGTADLNAFTTHHFTAYILTAVSAEATFSFLPILLDHVLHPLLSDDNFVTEVYHVKPDGNGGGVVYSEVLSQHMNASYICRRFMEKYLSPPDSPFHYNHGGDTDVIPALTNHDIIEYHRRYYDPRFMVCTITG
ncbi:LuxS/MPP-like metallohydrolase, partial [Ramicandelaber brevisporus]